jgi:hypothetical protein
MLGNTEGSPSYFWYATYDFAIEPPTNAGWIHVRRYGNQPGRIDGLKLEVMKDAPRLNNFKIKPKKVEQIARILSWHLYRFYDNKYMQS